MASTYVKTELSPYVWTLNTIELFDHVNVLSDEQKAMVAERLKQGGNAERLLKGEVIEIPLTKEKPPVPSTKFIFNAVPPEGPPHPKFLDGREVWRGADGSTWRYHQDKKKWIKTS